MHTKWHPIHSLYSALSLTIYVCFKNEIEQLIKHESHKKLNSVQKKDIPLVLFILCSTHRISHQQQQDLCGLTLVLAPSLEVCLGDQDGQEERGTLFTLSGYTTHLTKPVFFFKSSE